MRFTRLVLENFRAYQHADIPLDAQGLVLIKGRVHQISAFTSNGAGKSSLLPDGVVFALYGRTVQGIRGARVVNRRAGKDCRVTLEGYDDTDTFFRIVRPQKCDGERPMMTRGELPPIVGDVEVTAAVTDMLGMSYTSFVSCLVFGAGDTKFFTQLPDSAQKSILEELVGISELNEFQDRAKAHLKSCVEAREDALRFKESAEKEAALFEGFVTKLEASAAEYDRKKRERVEGYTKRIAELQQGIAEAIKKTKAEMATVVSQREIIKKAQKTLKDIYAKVNELRAERSDLRATLTGHKNALHELHEKIEQFGELGAECPTCQQNIPKKHKHQTEETFALQVKAVEIGIAATQKRIDELDDVLFEAEKVLSKADQKVRDAEKVERTALKDAELLASRQQAWKQQIKEMEKEQQELQADDNTDAAGAAEYREKLVGAQEKVKVGDVLIAQTTEAHQYAQFWTEGFGNGGIKSMLLDNILPRLNKSAKEYSDLFTDGEVSVAFDTITTTQSGARRDSFNVLVKVKEEAEEYDEASAGQRRRADVICTLALGDLASSRVRSSLNLCVIDEVFDGLDAAGIDRAIQVLHKLTETRGSVFVTTHDEQLSEYFSKVWTVNKTDRVATVEL